MMARKIKCKFCTKYFEKPTIENLIKVLWVNFCCLSHRRSRIKEKNDKVKLKVKVRKAKIKHKKSISITILKKKLWTIVSLYIRKRDSNEEWIWKCCSCNIEKPYTELQAGHYIPSWSSSFHRYNEKNIHIQCYWCNCWKWWNLIEYRPFMIEKYWETYVEWLFESRNTISDNWSIVLQELIIWYWNKLEKLKENK